MATDLLVTGFEHGSTSTAGQGLYASLPTTGSSSASVTALAAQTGSYGLRLTALGGVCWARWLVSTTDRFTMAQVKFRFNSLPPTGECTVFGLETAAGTMGQVVYVASAGDLKVRIGSSGVSMPTTITAGSTYLLNLRYDTDGATWTLDAWVNGTDQTTQTATGMANSTVDAVRTGVTGSASCQLDVDDIVVTSDTASMSLPGERQVVGISPNADGTHAVGSGTFRDMDTTPLTNGTTTAWQRVDDAPIVNMADWIEQTAIDASGYLELAFPNTSATTIVAARAIVAYHAGGTAKTSIFSSAVETVVHSGSMNAGGTLTFKAAMISPNGGTWDATDLDGLVARIGYASAVATTPKWDALMIEYAYEPSASVNKSDSDTFTATETQSGSGGGGGVTTTEFGPGGSWGLGYQNAIGVGIDGLVCIGADVAGFHISEDDGQTVVISNHGMGPTGDRALAGICHDADDADVIYGAALTGILKSTDRGVTWTRISTAVTWVGMNEVPNIGANRPRSTGNVLKQGSVGPSGNRWMYAATVNDGVFRSSNNGVTWTRIWGAANSTTYPRGLAVVSQSGTDDLYVGTFESGNGTGGLYHIDNAGGTSTTPTVTKMTTPFVCVEEVCAVVPDNSTRRIYVVGFAGSNASRSHGAWHAQNPGNATSAAWQRTPTTQIATTSPWAAVDAKARSGGLGDVVAIGCFSPRANSGNFEEVFISLDGGANVTCITLNAAKIHGDEVGGPGGPPWNAGESNWIGNAGHALGGPSQLVFNDDATILYCSRYAGAWKCVSPIPTTGRNWYPMMNALEVTINQSVISDPNVPGTVYLANIDRGIFASDDYLATFTLRGTGFNASRLMAMDTTQTPSHLYVGGGDRDANVDGDVVHFADAVGSSTNTSLQTAGGVSLGDLTGGKRCYGLAVRKMGGTVNVLAAVVGHGICRYRWDGAGNPTDGTWTTVKGSPPMSNASPGNKGAPFDWAHDDICVLYDPNSGVWRGKDGISVGGSVVMTSWTLLWSDPSSVQGVGDIKADPTNKERCFVATDAGLYRLDNIFSATDATDVVRTVITKPTNQTMGPIEIDELGRLLVTTRAQLTLPTPGIYRTNNRGAVNPSWTDLSDDYYHRGGQWPLDLDVAEDGTIYLAMDGMGSIVGTLSSETEVTVADTDSATMTDAETVLTTALVDVSDDDSATVTDAETSSAVGGYDAEVTADTPLAWWKMDATATGSGQLEDYGSGTDADMDVNGSPVLGEPTLVMGGGDSMRFRGAPFTDHCAIAGTPAKLQISGAFSIESWFMYPSGETDLGSIFNERYGDGNVRYALTFWDGTTDTLRPSFGWLNGFGAWDLATSPDDLDPDTIYHIVGTYDGSLLRIYVNGVLKDTTTPGTAQPGGTGNIQIAVRWDNASNEYLVGTVQHVAFYGTTLSPTRIVAHYEAGAGGGQGDNNLSDGDNFTLTETQSHDNEDEPEPPVVVPPPAPEIRHVIRSLGGVAYPPVEAFSATETAPGGYGPAQGRASLSDVLSAPHVYQAGATWQIWAGSTIIWEGMLLEPVIDGTEARLLGRGWGQMADQDVQRLLYLSESYADWIPGDSAPYGYQFNESYSATAEGGRLVFLGRKGDAVQVGHRASLIFHADGSRVTSVAGSVEWNDNGGQNQVLIFGSADFPGGINQAGTDLALGDAEADGFDRNFNQADADVAMIRIQRVDGADEFAETVRVVITDLRVRGAATEDEMSSSEVALDVFDRLGIEATTVTATGDDAMPLDVKDGTLADALNHASLISGLPWRIVSNGARKVGTLTEPVTWTTTLADGPTDLLPMQRFNRVLVRYRGPSGRRRQVVSEPADIGVADPYAATGAVFTYELDVEQAARTSDKMQALADRLLTALITERYTGDLERTWLTDPAGAIRPAYDLAAGDRIRVIDALGERGVTVTVATKVNGEMGVQFTAAETVPELDRYEARRR